MQKLHLSQWVHSSLYTLQCRVTHNKEWGERGKRRMIRQPSGPACFIRILCVCLSCHRCRERSEKSPFINSLILSHLEPSPYCVTYHREQAPAAPFIHVHPLTFSQGNECVCVCVLALPTCNTCIYTNIQSNPDPYSIYSGKPVE